MAESVIFTSTQDTHGDLVATTPNDLATTTPSDPHAMSPNDPAAPSNTEHRCAEHRLCASRMFGKPGSDTPG